jgi:antitoxin (DNA-binding transcriptional repressor) of toxin-antitoxin stability system
MSKIEHMSVAEVKRRFADVIGMVQHGDTRVVVERRGKAVAEIGPVGAGELHAGRELAKLIGSGGREGGEFHEMMCRVVEERRRRPPRPADLGRKSAPRKPAP